MNLIRDTQTGLPQLYVNGELIGGCDIVEELAQSGKLKTILERLKHYEIITYKKDNIISIKCN